MHVSQILLNIFIRILFSGSLMPLMWQGGFKAVRAKQKDGKPGKIGDWMSMDTHRHTHNHIHTHTHTHTHMHTHAHTQKYTRTYTRTQTHTQTHTHIRSGQLAGVVADTFIVQRFTQAGCFVFYGKILHFSHCISQVLQTLLALYKSTNTMAHCEQLFKITMRN
jgi:hypothetical protein